MQERETKRLPNPESRGWPDDQFSADLGHGADELVDHGDATEETRTPTNHEALPPPLDSLDRGERESVVILVEGTALREGSTYVDLDRIDNGPFRALAGRRAKHGERLVPKHRVGYDLWNRLVGRDAEPDIERPKEAR